MVEEFARDLKAVAGRAEMHAQVDRPSGILTPVPFTAVYLDLASVPFLN